VTPARGTPRDTFLLTLTNNTPSGIPFDSCSAPHVTSLATGREAHCPPPPDPAHCEKAFLQVGASLQVEWKPSATACDPRAVAPGVYEVTWGGFPQAAPARLELVPDPALSLLLRAEPASVRFGEPVRITVENPSGRNLVYNRCCSVPVILDPRARSTLCLACPECFTVVDLVPGESLAFDWTPGREACDETGDLPGRHRIIWGDFWSDFPGSGDQYFGEASVLVLPPSGRRLDLAVSPDGARAGDTVQLSAANPLNVSVWRAGCCDTAIFLDELGKESPCTGCPLDCAVIRSEEILPGGKVSVDVPVPGPKTPAWGAHCGLIPGRWSVIWGPNFGLVPGGEPTPPVYGYAELTVLPAEVEPVFVRGNCDAAGEIDITDAIGLLNYLFLGAGVPACLDACDSNDTGDLDLTDAVVVLNFLFLGGVKLPDPGPFACGVDPTPGQALPGACRYDPAACGG